MGQQLISRSVRGARWFATALLAFAGCAGIEDAIETHPTVGSASDGGAGAMTAPGTSGMCTVEQVTPPAIVLSSSAGDQSGEQLSFCTQDEQRGCGVCADSAEIVVKRFTIVHSGDDLSLGMPDGTLITPGPDRCQPECPPQFTLRALCSRELIDSRILTEDEAWTVELAPGAYEIIADGSFRADALTGSTGDSFGLIVDDGRERGVVDAGAPGTTCDANGGS